MTLIAHCSISGLPFLLGDLLLTRKAAPGLDIRVPTIPWGDPKNQQIMVNGLGPAGLVQKVNICSDDLALAWTGKAKAAQEIICEIRDKHNDTKFDFVTIGEYFSKLPESVVNDVSLIGLLANGKHILPFEYTKNRYHIPHPAYEKLWVAGSGSELFAKHQQTMDSDEIDKAFGHFPEADRLFPVEPGQKLSSEILKAQNKAQLLTGLMLTLEISTLNTLKSYFGGGFELALHNGIKFVKQPTTYFYWVAEIGRTKTHHYIGIAPVQAFNYTYKDDVLYLRAIYFNHNEESVFDETFPISPIYRSLTNAEEKPGEIKPDLSRVMSIMLVVKEGKLLNSAYSVHGINDPLMEATQKGFRVVNGRKFADSMRQSIVEQGYIKN